MFEFELDPIDPQLDFQEVVASLVSTAEGVIAEHPELRNALTPDDGAYEEAIRVRAACQRVLRLFEDASEKLPEQEQEKYPTLLMKKCKRNLIKLQKRAQNLSSFFSSEISVWRFHL